MQDNSKMYLTLWKFSDSATKILVIAQRWHRFTKNWRFQSKKSSQIRSRIQKGCNPYISGPGGIIWWKKRGRKSRVRVILTAFETASQLKAIVQHYAQKKYKIPRNSAVFHDTEFHIIPRNFRQFRIPYGIYGRNKNIRIPWTSYCTVYRVLKRTG
jgi:hypothetical protein